MRPNKITFCDSLNLMIFILSMTGNLEALPRIINWNVLGLGFIELILNQFNKFFMSCCNSSKTISKSLSHLYSVLSTAKLHMFVVSTKRKRSMINKLNSNGPKIDPCGMYLIMSTNHYTKSLLLCTVFNLKSSLVKCLILIYRCHKLQILRS